MPITGTAPILSLAIKTALLADPASMARDNDALEVLCSAIAQAVIDHLVANALVTVPPGVAVATAGGPAAQVGATTAPGLGTVT